MILDTFKAMGYLKYGIIIKCLGSIYFIWQYRKYISTPFSSVQLNYNHQKSCLICKWHQ